jgi:hypothetical protein
MKKVENISDSLKCEEKEAEKKESIIDHSKNFFVENTMLTIGIGLQDSNSIEQGKFETHLNSLEDLKSEVGMMPIIYGEIDKNDITGVNVPFISTYCLNVPLLFTIAVKCKTSDLQYEKYIFIQNPIFEQFLGKESPFTIRPHPIIFQKEDFLEDTITVAVSIHANENIDINLNPLIIEMEKKENNNYIKIHQRENGEVTFCPNNLWLSGLPYRCLKDDEMFSFISVINVDNRRIDTFHLLTGNAGEIYEKAINSYETEIFLGQLSTISLEKPHTKFHIDKLLSFYTHDDSKDTKLSGDSNVSEDII